MSERLKGLTKGGWHPKGKDGGKESWRKDIKGVDTVAGWLGKGKKGGSSEDADGHDTAPLSSLKDPASFGPPPRRTTTGLAPPPPPSSAPRASSNSGGLGAPLSREEIKETRQNALAREQAARQAEEEAVKPIGPYKVDTTGLSTAHLPPPPAFKRANRSTSPEKNIAAKPKPPSLPPRLPPRNVQTPADPPPSYNDTPRTNPPAGILNQGAMNRLGAAGVSIPGFGIGGSTSPPLPSRTNTTSPPVPPARTGSIKSPLQSGSQLSELQSRFSKMGTSSSPTTPTTPTSPTASTGGTTWAQKQAALKTASNFRNDPSKVSLSDAKEAATTANNFRERHGEQVATGLNSANSLNQKYGIADRMKSYTGPVSEAAPTSPTTSGTGKRPPPPPPPAKRRDLQGPPPIPMGSKPTLP